MHITARLIMLSTIGAVLSWLVPQFILIQGVSLVDFEPMVATPEKPSFTEEDIQEHIQRQSEAAGFDPTNPPSDVEVYRDYVLPKARPYLWLPWLAIGFMAAKWSGWRHLPIALVVPTIVLVGVQWFQPLDILAFAVAGSLGFLIYRLAKGQSVP